MCVHREYAMMSFSLHLTSPLASLGEGEGGTNFIMCSWHKTSITPTQNDIFGIWRDASTLSYCSQCLWYTPRTPRTPMLAYSQERRRYSRFREQCLDWWRCKGRNTGTLTISFPERHPKDSHMTSSHMMFMYSHIR